MTMSYQQPGPMTGQPQQIMKPHGPPHQMPPMQMGPPQPQMGMPQFPYPPQVHPYSVPGAFSADVTRSTEPIMACCPTCHFIGTTRIERKYTCGQITTGIIMILLLVFIIPGILILVLCRDYEHHCTRCNGVIGTTKAFCC